jgi:Arc/MetJ-type ribon-helix-helix transcriptional regulator
MSQRVVFTFDNGSLESLKQVQERGEYASMATAVRDAVQLSEVLQDQVADGFTEFILRNPRTQQEKTLVIPSLQRMAKAAKLEVKAS